MNFINLKFSTQSNSKYREESKQTSAMEETSDRNDDLTDLLNEAKHTILELQHEIESLKSEIVELRQQNRFFVTQMESVGNESKLVPTPVNADKDGPAAMPLEPIVIVNDNKHDDLVETAQEANENISSMPQTKKLIPPNAKVMVKNSRGHEASDQTTQSDNTYVV